VNAWRPASFSRLALSGAVYHWRSNLAVFLGVAVSAGVLVGALLVGDSVRFSLRKLALQRIGNVAVAVDSTSRPFDASIGARLERDLGGAVATVLSVPCAAVWQPPDGSEDRQVNRARVLGVEPGFWRFGPAGSLELLEGEVALGR